MHIFSPIGTISLVALVCLGGVGADELEAINIELPDASFAGTAVDHYSPVMETDSYKDREPFLAPKGTVVISKGKPVTASAKPLAGELSRVTNGDKAFGKSSVLELPEGLQWVQVDLEKSSEIYAVLVWHHHAEKRVYFDFVAQVADDPEFKTGVTTIYNNDYDNSSGLGVGEDGEYVDNHKGRLVNAKGVKGRYLRVYGQGNTYNEFTHFVEIEVWGK